MGGDRKLPETEKFELVNAKEFKEPKTEFEVNLDSRMFTLLTGALRASNNIEKFKYKL